MVLSIAHAHVMVLRVIMTKVTHLMVLVAHGVAVVPIVTLSLIVVIVMLLVVLGCRSWVEFIIELPIVAMFILTAAVVKGLIGVVNLLEMLAMLSAFLLVDVLLVISIIVMVKLGLKMMIQLMLFHILVRLL